MSYNNPGEVLTDIANSLRSLHGSTASIPYVEMPGLIKYAIGEPIDLSDYDGTSWVIPFIEHLDFNGMSAITDLFSYIDCDAEIPIHSLNLERFSINGKTSLEGLFKYSRLTNISGIEDWNTSSITDIHNMFYETHISNSLDLSNWDVSKIRNFYQAFFRMNTYDLNASGWTFYSGQEITYFFDGVRIQNLNLSNWNFTSTNLSAMFTNSTIGSLDLTGWDTRNVTNMSYMFANSNIRKIWMPSTFKATSVVGNSKKPFFVTSTPPGSIEIYTNASSAESQGWNPIYPSNFAVIHYNSTYQDFLNA